MPLKPLNGQLRTDFLSAAKMFKEGLPGSPQAVEYLAKRGLSEKTVRWHGLGVVGGGGTEVPTMFEKFRGRLAIPYLSYDGHVLDFKFRTIHPDVEPKYDKLKGLQTRLFNIRAMNEPSDTLVLTEGEIDAMSFTELDIPAISIPGAQNWKSHYGKVLQAPGYKRVVFFPDDDPAGEALTEKILKDVPGLIVLDPPAGANDVNDALKAGLGSKLKALALGIDEEEEKIPF